MNWALWQNSLLMSGTATALALGFGLSAAVFALGLGAAGRRVALGGAVVALALPPFLVTDCWLHLLGQTGVWRPWVPFNIYSLGGSAWILALLLWPVPMFLTLAAWSQIPASQIEPESALRGLGLLRWILLPAARPGLAQAATITAVLALGNFAVPAILQVKVFPAELWVRFSTNLDYGGAALLGIPLILPPLLLLAGLHRHPLVWPRLDRALPPDLCRRRLGGWWRAAGVLATVVLLLALAVPLVDLLQTRRTWIELPGAVAAGGPAILASVQFAAATATLTVGVGLAAWRWPLGPALWMLWLVPGVFLGVTIIFLFNRGPLVLLYQSSFVVLPALAARYSALGWQGAVQARRTVDPDLDDAARLCGATPWQRFRWVRWPQMAPLLAATWYIVYLLALWDAETVLLIVPPGGETLALRIFNLLHYGHNAQVDALCLVLLGLAVAPLALWQLARVAGIVKVA